MTTVTVSAKVPKELKRKIDEHRIRVSEIVRNALEKEVVAAEERRLKEKLRKVSERLRGKLSEKDIVAAVRSSREER